jgi:hypothetical protein
MNTIIAFMMKKMTPLIKIASLMLPPFYLTLLVLNQPPHSKRQRDGSVLAKGYD